MLDTLLNMNQTAKENFEVITRMETTTSLTNKIEDNNKETDDNENKTEETKNQKIIEMDNKLNSRLECLIENQINCEKITKNNDSNDGLQDDNTNSTISGSLTPTPPFNVDSSFIVEKDGKNNGNECFKLNNNLDNNISPLISLPLPSTPTTSISVSPTSTISLSQISNNTLDINDNNKTMGMEEFDSNSSDSAFESASESDTKILVEDFSKIDKYASLTPPPPPTLPPLSSSAPPIIHSHLQDQHNEKEQYQERKQEQEEQLQKSISDSNNSRLSINTKESINNCNNLMINNESLGTTQILSSGIRNRSLSSDSLSSDNSVDSTSDNLQISTKINEKLTKNDTLTRQKHNDELQISYKKPRGLQALILWNNDITKDSADYVADLLDSTKSLELLNIGKNILSNEFLKRIKKSLQRNMTISNLGLQSTHLNSEGIKILAEVLQFGGNNTLQRVDIRDNNVQVEGLAALADALKSNNSITRIDIDDIPKRIPVSQNSTISSLYSQCFHFFVLFSL